MTREKWVATQKISNCLRELECILHRGIHFFQMGFREIGVFQMEMGKDILVLILT